jgi:GNAT superfamily N-acetyltransferase
MKELYNNRDKYFPKEKYQLLSEEVWQVFTDFNNLDKIKTNCDMNVELIETFDYDKFGEILVENYQTGDNDDPYGNLDDGYKKGYKYNQKDKETKGDFYFIKADDQIVGTTESIYNDHILGIYSFSIKSDYRKRGIGKVALIKQLEKCREKNIEVAFLQTEKDFYPAKMYNKMGFKDIANVYYYTKIV